MATPVRPCWRSTSATPLALPPDGGLRFIWARTLALVDPPWAAGVVDVRAPEVVPPAAVVLLELLPPLVARIAATTAATISTPPASSRAPPRREVGGLASAAAAGSGAGS